MKKPNYSELYRDKKYKNLDKIKLFKLIKMLVSGKKILDIACGTGYLLDFLGGGMGIDMNYNLIAECKKNYPKNNFIVSDCYHIPLQEKQFDTIVMCMIIEHLTKPEKTLLEAKRLLKNSGNLIIVTPRRNDLFYKLFVKKDPTHVKEYTKKELLDLVSGFFAINNIEFGSVSTKIPSWMTYLVKSDILINCNKK